MKKLLLKVNNDNELDYLVDGFIIGVKNFSMCFEKKYSVSEIKKIKQNYKDKDIFVCVNSFIFNKNIESFKKILLKLDKLNLTGIIVSDLAALTYNLKTNIVLDQLHLNNSYLTIKFYENDGVSGIYLTNDITLEEINEIKKRTSIKLFKDVFTMPHLSSSRRLFLTNYYKHFKIKNSCNNCYIKEKHSSDYYKIIEEDNLTHIFSRPLNLLKYINDINCDYLVINSYMLDKKSFNYVVNSFVNKKILNNNKIDELYNSNSGFINKTTIYKIKENKDE